MPLACCHLNHHRMPHVIPDADFPQACLTVSEQFFLAVYFCKVSPSQPLLSPHVILTNSFSHQSDNA